MSQSIPVKCHNARCSTVFHQKPMGRTRKYCSNKCKHAAFYTHHQPIIVKKQRTYYDTHKEKKLQWATEYYIKNKDDIITKRKLKKSQSIAEIEPVIPFDPNKLSVFIEDFAKQYDVASFTFHGRVVNSKYIEMTIICKKCIYGCVVDMFNICDYNDNKIWKIIKSDMKKKLLDIMKHSHDQNMKDLQ